MITTIVVVAVLAVATFLFMQQKTFGKAPAGKRLARIEQSPNYREGSFQNVEPTEVTLKNASFVKMMKDFLNKPSTTVPPSEIPSVKTDLKTLKADKPTIVWFGHSSYLIKSKHINILVDPVFSGNASPISLFAKAFPGTDTYAVEDFPPIDMLILTHDHYDHLDYQTIGKIDAKVKKIYTSLGVGAHLEHWGISPDKITEFDWWESHKIADDIEMTATPARHFSGRSFTRGKTLWSSFVLKIHGYNIFVGGDSGYDSSFAKIGEKYGPFDIAMLETGQYGAEWPYIHMLPEETVMAAKALKAKVLLPVHWGKFVLANHEWNDPIKRVVKNAAENKLNLTTPLIGEPVVVDSLYPQKIWWNF